MKQYYKDFYGCSATIIQKPKGQTILTIKSAAGKLIRISTHKNFNAARSSLYRTSDSWHKIK